MLNPFHLSFVVPDKGEAKRFYVDILGCELGRDNPTWFDIIFYGHQLTIHQATTTTPAAKHDHFGPILNKEEWITALNACKNHDVVFLKREAILNEGQDNESGKFLVSDPASNILEFKYYAGTAPYIKQSTI